MKRVVVAALALVLASAAYAQLRPDPLAQAQADGCERFNSGLYTKRAPNWVYVNDKDYSATAPTPPPQWVKGTVNAAVDPFMAAHPAGGDNPFTHERHDMIVNVRPDPQYDFLVGGDPNARTGNFEVRGEGTRRLHTEWEEGAFLPFAWPEQGDRIELLGSWVWDCDHFAPVGEHTEFHPLRAVWVARNPGGASPRSPSGESEADLLISTLKTQAGTQADCAHRAKGSDEIFQACLASDDGWQDVSGTYQFFLRAPARPSPRARLHVRVVDRGSTAGHAALRLTRVSNGVRVAVDLNSVPGRRLVVAKQIFAGWRPTSVRALPVHLRVSFRQLLIRRAMDPGCPASNRQCPTPQTTLRDQNSAPPGEWNVYWNVAGIWSLWDPPLLRARDGQRFRGRQAVDLYVARGRPWRLYVFARECDFAVSARGAVPMAPCPRINEFGDGAGDDTAGHIVRRFKSPAASLGRHRLDATTQASTCPLLNRRGCFALTFDVRRIRDEGRRARR
ncbi:MAG: hypothetical protein M3282_04850 [Gemmatimonadota bacterium]|nr:hypothetical protein [Gemmatimonadota bacterium]